MTTSRKYKIGCAWDNKSHLATKAFNELKSLYPTIDGIDLTSTVYQKNHHIVHPKYDFIVTLGGDGIMLKTLHKFMLSNIPIYGINMGSIGFLLNEYNSNTNNLITMLEKSAKTKLHPLEMTAITMKGKECKALAVNEVSLLRQTSQSAKIRISINDQVRLDQLIADGILIATPAGSTAYNFAAHGPIVPIDANILLLTPISPFRPRRWRGALLSRNSKLNFLNISPVNRPISATADSMEVRDVESVEVVERIDIEMTILFDKDDALEERILKEQFAN